VLWKDGKQFKALLSGKGPATLSYDLQISVSQGDVVVTFRSLGAGVCMSCAGLPFKDGSDGKIFQGKDCTAPPSCEP
jgi:hypothetical protein